MKEYKKIPKEKIRFYEENKDKKYIFVLNPKLSLAEQNISKEANAIIVEIFRKYFATEKQKIVINEILKLNEIKNKSNK